MDITPTWLLLVYTLPAAHARARVQAWRRLQRVGAVPLKNSAYVLPCSAEAREDFEWIRNEIVAIGGQAMLLVADTTDAAARDEIVDAFRSARAREFDELAREASTLLKRSRSTGARSNRRHLTQAARRLRERFDEVVRIDYFQTPARDRVGDLLAQLEHDTRRGDVMKIGTPSATLDPAAYRNKVWLTRPRPGVDRMSSAWLIRRFIDPDARFIFGDSSKAPAAIPFDTFHADFGHRANHCTFETLCERFGVADPAVQWIARIVHDLDLKEHAFNEPDAATVARMVEGLRRSHPDDQALLVQGIATFEALYQSYAGAQPGRTAGRRAANVKRATRRSRRRSDQ